MTPETLLILRWATGADVALPPDFTPQRDWLLDLLTHHRLSERFLDRMTRERPPWADTGLRVALWSWCRQARAQGYERELAMLQEIARRLPDPTRPLVVVKGLATFALTGDRRSLGRSNDIDVLAEDPHALCEIMQGMGYVQKPPVGGHEIASLTRDGVVIDLHRHFPVKAYPPGLLSADLTSARHPGRWEQPFGAHTERQIGYDDLRGHLCAGVLETPGLAVADPNMAVLLLCAHEFRTYLFSPIFYHAVKLATLANVRDLARHPLFDPAAFRRFVDEWDGWDSVRFVSHLLARFLADDPLGFCDPEDAPEFPRILSFSGGWATLGPEVDCFTPLDTAAVVRSLRGATVKATAADHPTVYRVGGAGEGEAVARVLVQSLGRPAPRFRFWFTWGEEEFSVALVVENETPQEYLVTLYSYRGDEDTRPADAVRAGAGVLMAWETAQSVAPGTAGEGVLRIPRSTADLPVDENTISLLLGVGSATQGNEEDKVLCLVPLHIRHEREHRSGTRA